MERVPPVIRKLFIRFILALKFCFEGFIRFIGPVFVVLAGSLICGVIYVHFVNSIPYYGHYLSVGGVVHVVMSVYISFCIIYNYLCAVFVDPGMPPTSEELGLTEAQILALQNDQVITDNTTTHKIPHELKRFCKKCNRPKPDRTHHCHVCGKCVLKMDHHCPWVANCVGYHNHHFFILFIFWLWFGCGYAAALGFIPFSNSSNASIPFRGVVPRGAVIFSFIIAIAVFISLSLMLTWQAYLILSAQTTIEFYFNRTNESEHKKQGRGYRNPFDLGVPYNFQYFFGTRDSKFWFSWLVPGGVKPPGDGITYPKRRDDSK